VISLSAHERGPVPHARVALPIAAWAEIAGTVTNASGRVQRMHAAFAPPGTALPGWEAIVRLAHATGVKQPWTHAREVFKDMTAQVPAWKDLTWTREVRPLALRFAGSRG
jgi:predicted molibdopterin-dependent oxidoreductase YjgC